MALTGDSPGNSMSAAAEPLGEAERGKLEARIADLENQIRELGGRLHTFQTMVETAPEAIFLADTAGRILEVNAAACRQFQFTREELLERGVTGILPAPVANSLMTAGVMDEYSVLILDTALCADG